MTTSKSSNSLAPAEFQILLALADGPKHGHGIKLDVRQRTDGEVTMGPGTLYTAIKRLVDREQIEEVAAPAKDTSEDERRRYYRVTADGRQAARDEAHRMAVLLGIAADKRVLKGWAR